MKSKTLPAWARLVCTAAAALVFLLVYEWAVYGVSLGKIYLPASAWSDEVYYAKQLSAVVTTAYRKGTLVLTSPTPRSAVLPPGGLRCSTCTPSRG